MFRTRLALPLLLTIVVSVFAVSVSVQGAVLDVTLPKAGVMRGLLNNLGIHGRPGNLVDRKGRILKVGAGDPPVLKVTLGWKRIVRVQEGQDKLEPVVTVVKTIPSSIRSSGNGALFKVIDNGKAGRKLRTIGSISKIVLKETYEQPKDKVYERYNPELGKYVALTFDDGPYPYTERILDILKSDDIKATFFFIGKHVQRYPAIAKKVADLGHDVGNHTFSHVELADATDKEIKSEITSNEEIIEKITGVKTRLYRPVGGRYSARTLDNVGRLGYTPILWSEDSKDWEKAGVPSIIKNSKPHFAETAIILLHDGGGNRSETVKALPGIIETYKSMGYRFVTVTQLLEMQKATNSKQG